MARSDWLRNFFEHESGKCLFDMRFSFLYWFLWHKDFKWFIKSSSNTFKLKQFILCHSQEDRQTVSFFSWFFRDNFFPWRKKDPKSGGIAIFGALTKEDIDVIRQRGLNIVYHVFFMSLFSYFHFCFLLGTHAMSMIA